MNDDYCIAIDVGTSRVAAATAEYGPDGAVRAASFTLGRRADAAPAVAFVGEDGEILLGDTAERRGLGAPARLVREFKRSLGDEVPFVVAGTALTAQELFARTVADVIATVAQREGRPAARVVITHPVSWGPHRLGLVGAALTASGVNEVVMITEPEAAGHHYEAAHALEPGQVIVVYDLGGGTFDLAVLRKDDAGALQLIGAPVGLEDLGGADFDDAVLRHAVRSCEIDAATLAADDEATRLALAQLRRECVEAKEALSFDSDAAIPVLVPGHRTSIRLTRAEFEAMIAPGLARAADAVEDALDAADVAIEDVAAILLVGGSSRIPLVTQTLSERFTRPLAVDADPKSSMALGAARWGLAQHEAPIAAALAILGSAEPAAAEDVDTAAALVGEPAPVGADAAPAGNKWYAAALIAGAVVIAGGIILGGSMAAGLRLTQDGDIVTSAEGGSDTGTAGKRAGTDLGRGLTGMSGQRTPAEAPGSAVPAVPMVDLGSGPTRPSAPQTSPPTGLRFLDAPPPPTPAQPAPAQPATPARGGGAVLDPGPEPTPAPTPTPTPTPTPEPSTPTPSPPAPDPTPTPNPTTPAPDPIPTPDPTTPAPDPSIGPTPGPTPESPPPAPEPDPSPDSP